MNYKDVQPDPNFDWGAIDKKEVVKDESMDKAYEDGAISKIFTTNLIYRTPELLSREWYCEVNLCKYVALIIDTLNHDMTISDLLNPVSGIHNLMDKVNKAEK